MISKLDKVLGGSKLHSRELVQLHRVLLSGLIAFNPHTRQFSIANTGDTVSTNRLEFDGIDQKLLKMLAFFNNPQGKLALENVALHSSDKSKKMTAFLTLNILAFLGNGYRISMPEPDLPKKLWSISRSEAKILAQKVNTSWTLFDYVKLKARVSYEISKGHTSKPSYLKEIEKQLQAYEALANTHDFLGFVPNSPLVRFFTKREEAVQSQPMPRMPRQAESTQIRVRENQKRLREKQQMSEEAVRFYGELKSKQSMVSRTPYDQQADLQLLSRANLDANNAIALNPKLKGICIDAFEDIKRQLVKKYGNEIQFTSLYRQDLSGRINPVSSRVMLRNPVESRYAIIQPKVSSKISPKDPPPSNTLQFAKALQSRLAQLELEQQSSQADPGSRIRYERLDYLSDENEEQLNK